MHPSQWVWSQDVVFPGVLSNGHAVIEAILAKLEEYQWPSKDAFAVHMALEEAIANAIEHGNKQDPEKNIRLLCFLALDRILIEVEDEGKGFVPGKVPDPRDCDHISIPSGRGVLLIRSFMNSVSFNERGNRIIMERILCPSSNAEAATGT